jgi:hypothetical protein
MNLERQSHNPKLESKEMGPVPVEYPDRETCRVKRSFLEDNFECLNKRSKNCPYLMSFGDSRFCRHPAAMLIFEWRD